MTTSRRPVCDSARATGWRHRLADPAILVRLPSGRVLGFCWWPCLLSYCCNLPFEESVMSSALVGMQSTAASGTAG